MNFELKTLSLSAAAAHPCDLLVVLVPEGFKPRADALSSLAAHALKAGDLDTKAGKLLPLYAPLGVSARRVALLGCGDGTARAVRQAVLAAGAMIKAPSVRRLALIFAAAPQAGAVGAAVRAVSEASYVYTATKSKAEPRALARVAVEVADGVWELTHPYDGLHLRTRWEGEPYLIDGIPAPVPSPAWRCSWMEVFGGQGLVFGSTLSAAAADWSLSWADPDPAGSPDATGAYLSAAGDAAIGAGSGLLVKTVFGSGGGGFYDLTAAVFVAGADAGTLGLRVTYGSW